MIPQKYEKDPPPYTWWDFKKNNKSLNKAWDSRTKFNAVNTFKIKSNFYKKF